MQVSQWRRGEFEITTDQDRLDIDTIHEFLALESEWSRGISRATVEKSIKHSLCFTIPLYTGRVENDN